LIIGSDQKRQPLPRSAARQMPENLGEPWYDLTVREPASGIDVIGATRDSEPACFRAAAYPPLGAKSPGAWRRRSPAARLGLLQDLDFLFRPPRYRRGQRIEFLYRIADPGIIRHGPRQRNLRRSVPRRLFSKEVSSARSAIRLRAVVARAQNAARIGLAGT